MTNAGVPGSPPLNPSTANMRFTERFTRTADDTIEYRMTVEDPEVLTTGSWSAAFPLKLDNDYLMFEYACHEGNTEPSGFCTSMCSQECGFTHSIMTTLPSRVTGLF
jgi:hypothetical protein